MSFTMPIYIKFDRESLDEALDKVNKIFDELFTNDRYIPYMSFRIRDGLPLDMFLTHSPNVKQSLRYELRSFKVPEDTCLAQQVLEREFLSAQDEGWYIKHCKISSTDCTLLMHRGEIKHDY